MRKFEAIRTAIKVMTESQRNLKPQRKLSYIPDNNSTAGATPYGATELVKREKYELRHLFQAYAILKGIDRPVVKKPSNYNGLILDEKKVQEMVEIFTPIEVEQDAVAS